MEKIKSNLNISTNDLKEYAKELYNQILNDEFYHVLVEEGWNQEEIFNNVTKFKEYLDDMHKAQSIKTFEDCLKYNMTQRLILVRNGKFIDRDYITLLPFKEYTEYLERFVARDFGSLPTDADLDKCMKKLKNGILGEFKKNKWVYLYGVQRSGRSYAALAFLNYIYKKRKETIERCFGDGKENFGLRFTRYKGAKRVLQGILLLFSCMNLKKLALRKKLIVNYGV